MINKLSSFILAIPFLLFIAFLSSDCKKVSAFIETRQYIGFSSYATNIFDFNIPVYDKDGKIVDGVNIENGEIVAVFGVDEDKQRVYFSGKGQLGYWFPLKFLTLCNESNKDLCAAVISTAGRGHAKVFLVENNSWNQPCLRRDQIVLSESVIPDGTRLRIVGAVYDFFVICQNEEDKKSVRLVSKFDIKLSDNRPTPTGAPWFATYSAAAPAPGEPEGSLFTSLCALGEKLGGCTKIESGPIEFAYGLRLFIVKDFRGKRLFLREFPLDGHESRNNASLKKEISQASSGSYNSGFFKCYIGRSTSAKESDQFSFFTLASRLADGERPGKYQ
ncbi:MAG: hypothetical protein LBH37_01765 [Oscillospiraceae bacterium]|jgi:hypothetical protein|nr:hypothetical protein [Oscillospiraceae bacterium]